MLSIIKKTIALLILGISIPMFSSVSAFAQKPGAIVSASALGGIGQSSIGGSSQYMALRGTLQNYFLEVRRAKWGVGGSSDMIDEKSGILVGYQMSISQIVLSGAAGLAQVTRIPAGSTTSSDYSALGYEAQAIYNIPLALGTINLGIGANYMGETSTDVSPSGLGAMASVSVGF
jgi:hypothetical protein